eukprot:1419356-Karenia_brevis.AAC.1
MAQYAHLDAITAFRNIDGAGQEIQIPELPDTVIGPPPQDINAYSDGSCSRPNFRLLALNTAGVWWPQRPISTGAPLEFAFGE